jgi:hypothetical protein
MNLCEEFTAGGVAYSSFNFCRGRCKRGQEEEKKDVSNFVGIAVCAD